jgi:predicted TIM-barrel fold metal-dependent hydrolase
VNPTTTTRPAAGSGRDPKTPLGIIDCDVHPWPQPGHLTPYLPERWRSYVASFGTRGVYPGVVGIRPFAARQDAWPEADVPGGDPEFAREQLLDLYDIDHAILNCTKALFPGYFGGNQPRGLSDALLRATNEWLADRWLAADERWLGAICTHFDDADSAVREIARCREDSDRWAQVLLPVRMTSPAGNPRYRPILRAAVERGLPVGIHVSSGFSTASYFYESHVSHPLAAYGHLASLIFEGAFDELPDLKIVIMETNWSWVAPYAWRLDRSWNVLRDEVPELQRKPSEYIGRHLWVTTQPAEEPEKKEWFAEAYDQYRRLSGENRLMFTTDYPHWDFDSPTDALPRELDAETLQDLMWRTASGVYGLDLRRAER